jgi:hypothetical protein
LNIPEDKISSNYNQARVVVFGRRLKTDYVIEAAELSSIIKKPG